jgi:hypothetical protein
MPADARFSLKSGLYEGRGIRIFGKGDATEKETKEAGAIGAAASRAESDG